MDLRLRWDYWHLLMSEVGPEAFDAWVNCQWSEIVSHYEEAYE